MNFNKIRQILDASTWVIFFASVIFSLVTVVAQNAVPGDSLYGFKLGYEKVMLASSRFLNRQVDLQIEFVARRFSETTKVLSSKYGSESLHRLDSEVESTATTITMIEDPEEKKVAARKYIAQLNVISSGLGAQKQNIVRNYGTPTATTATNAAPVQNVASQNPAPVYNNDTHTYVTATPQPVATNTNNTGSTTQPQIVNQIDNTQTTIQETIQQMQDITQGLDTAPSPTPTDTPPPPTDTPVPPTPTDTPPPPTDTPVPPTPTSPPSIQNQISEFCQKHPDKCNGNNNNGNNND